MYGGDFRSEASRLFEEKWRAVMPAVGLPTSRDIESADFGDLAPYILMGKFTRPTGPKGEGARMDVDHAGQGIRARLNVDVTGFEYFRRLLPDEKTLIVGVFESLFDHACGRWRVMFYRFDTGMKISVDTTLFPYICAETGAEYAAALIVPAVDAAKSKTAARRGRAYAAEAGPDAEWIDLGSGIPSREMLTLESA